MLTKSKQINLQKDKKIFLKHSSGPSLVLQRVSASVWLQEICAKKTQWVRKGVFPMSVIVSIEINTTKLYRTTS